MMNIHWMPVSTRCLTTKVRYDAVYKLEEGNLDKQIEKALKRSGYKSTHRHRQHVLSAEEKTNRLQRRIEMYTQAEGIAHEYELVELVRSIYSDDINFGNYS